MNTIQDDVKPHVLIVDDDEEIRATIRAVLEDSDYEILEAPDGLVALEILRGASRPLVVLSNHNMPRLDGPGLFSFVMNDSQLARRNAFIYMTAGNRVIPPSLSHDLTRLQVPVLRKPFDIDELLELIEDAEQRLQSIGSG